MSRFALGSRDPQQPGESFDAYQDRTNSFCIADDNPNRELLVSLVDIALSTLRGGEKGGEDEN